MMRYDNKTITVNSQKTIHDGYLKYRQYSLTVPSFQDETTRITLDKREIVHTKDSIGVLLYAPNVDGFILCEEFRIGVLMNKSGDYPFILQCVLGTIEDKESPIDTAYKEIKEETGLIVDSLIPVAEVYKSPGLMTEKTYLYYSEVPGTPSVGIHGVGNEEIKTHLITRAEMRHLLNTNKLIDSATLLIVQWFFNKNS